VLFDFHTHGKRNQGALTSLFPEEWAVNANGKGLVSIGFHPWYVTEKTESDPFWNTLKQLAVDGQIDAIGETGLDRLRYSSPIEIQTRLFGQHKELAEETNLPLIIHCVRSFSDILALRKKYPKNTWIMHGFIGNEYEIKQAIEKDIKLSPGIALLLMNGNQNHKLFGNLRIIPPEFLYLETDAVPGISIGQIYSIAEKNMEIPIDALAKQIQSNLFRDFPRSREKLIHG